MYGGKKKERKKTSFTGEKGKKKKKTQTNEKQIQKPRNLIYFLNSAYGHFSPQTGLTALPQVLVCNFRNICELVQFLWNIIYIQDAVFNDLVA